MKPLALAIRKQQAYDAKVEQRKLRQAQKAARQTTKEQTYYVVLPDGTEQTRRSKNVYTHGVLCTVERDDQTFAYGIWRWSTSENLARKFLGSLRWLIDAKPNTHSPHIVKYSFEIVPILTK